MALNIDRSNCDELNLQVLQRSDPQIMEILNSASHVVIYEFDQSTQEWSRKDVEGCLFVVKRYSGPRFQIVVQNRLNTTNLTVPLTYENEMDIVDSFLILRCTHSEDKKKPIIYGIWFYPDEDRLKMSKILKRIIGALRKVENLQETKSQSTNSPPSDPEKHSRNSGKSAGDAILGMITSPRISEATTDEKATSIQISTSSNDAPIGTTLSNSPSNDQLSKLLLSSNTPTTTTNKPTNLLVPSSVMSSVAASRSRTTSNSSTSAGLLTPSAISVQSKNLLVEKDSKSHIPSVSKDQLREVLISLIKTDDEFMDCIHRAYTNHYQ